MIRVTEVLDYLTEPELLSWMLKTSKAKREAKSADALVIGSYVDRWIQNDLFPGIIDQGVIDTVYQASADNCIIAWTKFKIQRPDIIKGIVSLQSELSDGEIVGHPDIIYNDTRRWGIIDIKTSRAIYPRYWTQTAKYSDLKRLEMYPTVRLPRFIGILRLDKETGEPFYAEIKDEAQIAYEVKVFEAYLTAYKHNYNVREFIRQQLENEVLGV